MTANKWWDATNYEMRTLLGRLEEVPVTVRLV